MGKFKIVAQSRFPAAADDSASKWLSYCIERVKTKKLE